MSHSYAQNHIHLVFSTKDRQKLIPRSLQKKLWAYMAGICKQYELLTFAIGGMEDHVHLLFRLSPVMALSHAISVVKANSSKWLREHGTLFAWQKGYGAFSVSSSNINTVIRYIDTQEAHHRRRTFEQEFVALLERHGVQYNPDFVFG
jgi:REP element-mobilizing transposase RayT